jgi:hypothetical protein
LERELGDIHESIQTRRPPYKNGRSQEGLARPYRNQDVGSVARDFEEHGEEAIKICRLERPNEYLKLVASLLPREVEATIDGNVEVTHQIEHIRRTIIDPKVITVQPARLLPKVEPEADLGTLKADLGGLHE